MSNKERKPIIVNPKALQGDRVRVLNYRRRPAQWETGVVTDVEVKIRADGSYWIHYAVGTERTSPDHRGRPHSVRLYVGDEKIELLEAKP